jgi:hypothetical protein
MRGDFCERIPALDGPTILGSAIKFACARAGECRRSNRRSHCCRGRVKSTIRTFQGDNPSAVYRYYWWHDNCYVRDAQNNYQLVSPDYCHR